MILEGKIVVRDEFDEPGTDIKPEPKTFNPDLVPDELKPLRELYYRFERSPPSFGSVKKINNEGMASAVVYINYFE